MKFEISARTILQLGSELISSDGISFYEMIKNAIDARSPDVKVRVESRMPLESVSSIQHKLTEKKLQPKTLAKVRGEIRDQLDKSHKDFELLDQSLQDVDSQQQLASFLDEANYIEFADSGNGMTADILKSVFLRVGTPFRLEEKQESGDVILGEKGIGRLSAMRLGKRIRVHSTQKGEAAWHVLEIDWRQFEDPTLLLEDVPIESITSTPKTDKSIQGTIIRISALTSAWSYKKLDNIAAQDLSRFSDPFMPDDAFPISVTFNDRPIEIDILDQLLFEHAHATIDAHFCICPKQAKKLTGHSQVPVLFGQITYDRFGRTQPFRAYGDDFLHSLGLRTNDTLVSLGPFSVKLYWFNRLYTTAVEGIGSIKHVRDLIKRWAGGLMVFRDGFRVQPYAGPDDDWLSLDRRAFSTGGFKLNRQQIVGKVDITTKGNPSLVDQTNREGFCDCPEYQALVNLLYHLLRKRFKPFLEAVEAEQKSKSAVSFQDLGDRFDAQKDKLEGAIQNLKKISSANPRLKLDSLVKEFASLQEQITETLNSAEAIREGMEEQGSRFLRLAGAGLMVEILAHELHRSVNASAAALTEAIKLTDDTTVSGTLRSSKVQLHSLAKRLSVLDRLTTSGRQRKKEFDAIAALNEITFGRKDRLVKHHIGIEVLNHTEQDTFPVIFVEGMFYQLIENLIENSIYWVKVKREFSPTVVPCITISLTRSPRRIVVFDNGMGVDPEDAEQIFLPFFSLRADDAGKGLGLYISKEIAEYHGATLELDHDALEEDGRLHSFVLEFKDE